MPGELTFLLALARDGDTSAKNELLERVYEELRLAVDTQAEDMLARSEALGHLEPQYPRPHKLVMLRFFAGLSTAEASQLMGVTERTLERDWRFAKAFFHKHLSGVHP